MKKSNLFKFAKLVNQLVTAVELPSKEYKLYLVGGLTRIVHHTTLDELVKIANENENCNDFYVHRLDGTINTAVA